MRFLSSINLKKILSAEVQLTRIARADCKILYSRRDVVTFHWTIEKKSLTCTHQCLVSNIRGN